jgi:hypothetical protein
MPPTFGNGKICYVVMPAGDVAGGGTGEARPAREITALFRDPGGNVLGIYLHGSGR